MSESGPVQNLRGGIPTWLSFIIGPLLGALVVAAGAVWAIAKMPDGGQFHEMGRDVTSVKLDVAVLKAHQETADERSKHIELQLDTLISQKRK